jgi:hypothetical protein
MQLLKLLLAHLTLSKLPNVLCERVIKADTLCSRLCITCKTTGGPTTHLLQSAALV